ncbi:hypothetical protein A2311_04850 [candidate division WOR-1 bacterium RIFOXYB2_FULL_48_7]|uniref:Yip1 domain-containing protein n=1 Tax=candidate division WOR-1 bacterium RIFOXYB2_FULL_48_7 TaxID=1802583 RepID=A0A1F4TWC7_UNCSA|nr:MAG: hypothetical protein A2311_04850 [candidate division WOR-1 bacterium RIFOXYB2_FULL_48_7]
MIISRPILFFSRLKEENWRGQSLTFLLITAWLLAFFMSIAVFILQYIPIGATLVEGIAGWKFVTILPVLLALAIIFFLITLLIMGGLLVGLFFTGFFLIGYCLHYLAALWGGKGNLNRIIQSSFYSSAAVQALLFGLFLALTVKAGWLTFPLFKVGFNFLIVLIVIFSYGLWAIMVRKVYGLPKWQSFIVAIVPSLLLLILLFIFDKIALQKVEAWITPLK